MIYIVTDPELGWDCVIGAFSSKEGALKCALSRSGLDPNDWEEYLNGHIRHGCASFDNAVIHEKELSKNFNE